MEKKMKWEQRELGFRRYVPTGDGKYDCYDGIKDVGLPIFKRFTVQYTGRDDITGEKIFEADICKIQVYDIGNVPDEYIAVVHYSIYYSAMRYYARVEDTGLFFNLYSPGCSEIIGNAFQNPELVNKYNLDVFKG